MSSALNHLTSMNDAFVHDSGWVKLQGTPFEVVRLPLGDRAVHLADGRHLFARLTYRAALGWCERNHCQLIDKVTLDAYRKVVSGAPSRATPRR